MISRMVSHYRIIEKMGGEGLIVFFSTRSLEVLGASDYKAATDEALEQCSAVPGVRCQTVLKEEKAWRAIAYDSVIFSLELGGPVK